MIDLNLNPERKDLRLFAALQVVFFSIIAGMVWYNTGSTTTPAIIAGVSLVTEDLERARKTLTEDMPPVFDYLEGELDGKAFLVGDRLSIADITVACCLTQLVLVAGNPDASKWPSLAAHYDKVMARESFQPSLAICKKVVPEPFDL